MKSDYEKHLLGLPGEVAVSVEVKPVGTREADNSSAFACSSWKRYSGDAFFARHGKISKGSTSNEEEIMRSVKEFSTTKGETDRCKKSPPHLWFDSQAEEAMHFYVSLFKNSSIIRIERYRAGEEAPEGTVKYAMFSLNGQEFIAMDSHGEHSFTFIPAISFLVNCEAQEEVDELWDKLAQGGEREACGWLQDKSDNSTHMLDLAYLSRGAGDRVP